MKVRLIEVTEFWIDEFKVGDVIEIVDGLIESKIGPLPYRSNGTIDENGFLHGFGDINDCDDYIKAEYSE